MAAAALALVADGRLSLDALVDGRPFSLRHLLQHRAGHPEYGSLAAHREAIAGRETPWPRDLLRQRIRADALTFEPGQDWPCSNVGYLLVCELVEAATGADLGPALHRLVLAPSASPAPRSPASRTTWPRRHGATRPATIPAGRVTACWLVGLPAPPCCAGCQGTPCCLSALLAETTSRHPLAEAVSGRPWRTARSRCGLGLTIGVGEASAICVGHSRQHGGDLPVQTAPDRRGPRTR